MFKWVLLIGGGLALGWYIWGREVDTILENLRNQLEDAETRLAALKKLQAARLAANQRLTDAEAKELVNLETSVIPSLVGQIQKRKEALEQRK